MKKYIKLNAKGRQHEWRLAYCNLDDVLEVIEYAHGGYVVKSTKDPDRIMCVSESYADEFIPSPIYIGGE